MQRRLVLILATAASACLLSGCVVFTGLITGAQPDIVGKLRLTFTVCASGFDDGDDPDPENEDHPGCPDDGNGDAYAFDGPHQLLFALRVPVGTGTPATISATPGPAPPASGPIVLSRNASYAAELQSAVPAPAGTAWVGYVSSTYDFAEGADDVPAQSASVNVDLDLPPTPDGGPFVGPLGVRPVVGVRDVIPAGAATAPVDCGADPFAVHLAEGTVCVDSPSEAQIAFDLNFPTRDFGVLAGNATASPGQTVPLPFNVRGAGALPAGLTATLTASTDLPGVGVAPSQPTAALANGSNTRVTVPVEIPKAAGPGTFDVTLTGRLANGQARSATAKLTVRDRQKPVLSAVRIKPKRFKAATRRRPKRGTTVSYALSEAAAVRAVVERCAKRARRKGSKRRTGRCLRFKGMRGAIVQGGAPGPNSFRFSGRLRGKALKAGPYRLALTATDAAANKGATVRARFGVRR